MKLKDPWRLARLDGGRLGTVPQVKVFNHSFHAYSITSPRYGISRIDGRVQTRGSVDAFKNGRYRSKLPVFGKVLTSRAPKQEDGFKKVTEGKPCRTRRHALWVSILMSGSLSVHGVRPIRVFLLLNFLMNSCRSDFSHLSSILGMF